MAITTEKQGGPVPDAGDGGSPGTPARIPAQPAPAPAPPVGEGRVRQPVALIRLLLGLSAIGLTLFLADLAQGTAVGIDADVAQLAGLIPGPVAAVAAALTTAGLLLVPVWSAGRRLLGPDRRRTAQHLADGLLAAVLAYGVSLALDLWIAGPAPDSLALSLTHLPPTGPDPTEPVYGYLAPVLAFLTASGARERRLPRLALALSALAGLASGYATPLALLLALLLGSTVAHGTLYAVGAPDPRPRPEQLLRSLREAGLRPLDARPVAPDRYLVRQYDGRPDLDVQLLDLQALTAALFQRAWRRLRLRTAPHPRALRSLRTGLEHEALVSYAALAAGVRTRRIAATVQLTRDTALVAYQHLPGRTLDELADEELTDGLLTDAWTQLGLLQRREISHRALVPGSVLVDAAGAVHLVDLADGDIAASELVLRCDLAQLLTTLALRVGAERAVRTAVAVLGPDAVGAALPLLQPIALARATRAELKRAGLRQAAERAAAAPAGAPPAGPVPELLDAIRAEVLRSRPQAPGRPVKLERLRPRMLLAVGGGVLAACLLLPQFFTADNNPIATMADADPGWLALALLLAAASHLAAAMGFVGFVPERLHFPSAVLTQVAGSFVKLVSPGGVGGVALNTRFLQRSGIPTAQALSSVGVGQLLGLVLHLLQLGAFVYLLGQHPGAESGSDSELKALQAVVGGLAGAGVLLALVAVVPRARQWLATRLRPLTSEVLPRLLDLLRSPGRLAVGVAGQLLVSLCLVACLYCCARAIGREPAFASVAVVFLIGNAIGNAAPTPGGVGAVDGALAGLLTQTASMDPAGAAATVVLYRLLTLLLPVLPGWASFTWLQRRGAL
ncbi:lysylphosphatidylglycerol synthase domain-containing protein [Kitasatospora sp. NPDC054939]